MLKYNWGLPIVVLFSIQLNLWAHNCENFSFDNSIFIFSKTNSIYLKRLHKSPRDDRFKKSQELFFTLNNLKSSTFYCKRKALDFELNTLDLFSPKYKNSLNSQAYNFFLALAQSHHIQEDTTKKTSGGASKVRLNYNLHREWFLDLRFDHTYQFYSSDPNRSLSSDPSASCIKVGAGVGYKF